jgi:two-component system chemotaxis sensor kinase CheA
MAIPEHLIKVFKDEAAELLAELESAVLALEANPEGPEEMGRVFRLMHTLKGSSGMFGFDDVSHLTHRAESLLDRARSGTLTVDRTAIDLILATRDMVAALMRASEGGPQVSPAQLAALEADLEALVTPPAAGEANGQPAPRAAAGSPAHDAASCYSVRLRLRPNCIRCGVDPLALLAELKGLGRCVVVTQAENLPALADIEPDLCYLAWDVVLTSRRGVEAVRDVFMFVGEDEWSVREIDSPAKSISGEVRLGDILVERGDLSRGQLEEVLANRRLVGEELVLAGVVSPEKVRSALAEQAAVREASARHEGASVRVAAEKLDRLINLVGELVITQAQLTQNATVRPTPELSASVEGIERLTGELRDCVLGVRMLPVGSALEKFRRLVRELAHQLGKDARFDIEGGETELDKTVIERISDPLVHLIRNSLDHGLESPEEREAAGKPREGRLRISAAQAGGAVSISVEDDGRGLDATRILAKARERGLVEPGQTLSEAEIHNLIFMPGFSTAEAVTGVSGRGVGMDVVRREVERLRGQIEVTSRPGQGSRITLRLPLTLAIIDGLLVEAAGSRYVLPLSCVSECLELGSGRSAQTHGNLVSVRGEAVPFIRLRDTFAAPGERPEGEQVVVVEAEGLRVGLVADRIIGNSQAVIKALGRAFGQAEGVSGATILGDGTVALIIDPAGLVRLAQAEEASLCAGARLGRQRLAAAAAGAA